MFSRRRRYYWLYQLHRYCVTATHMQLVSRQQHSRCVAVNDLRSVCQSNNESTFFQRMNAMSTLNNVQLVLRIERTIALSSIGDDEKFTDNGTESSVIMY
jgi:hypothetical protein